MPDYKTEVRRVESMLESSLPRLMRGEYEYVARDILGPPPMPPKATQVRSLRTHVSDSARTLAVLLCAATALIGALLIGIELATPARPLPAIEVPTPRTIKPANTATLRSYTERTVQDVGAEPPELTFAVRWDPVRSCVDSISLDVKNYAPLRTDHGDPVLRFDVPPQARCPDGVGMTFGGYGAAPAGPGSSGIEELMDAWRREYRADFATPGDQELEMEPTIDSSGRTVREIEDQRHHGIAPDAWTSGIELTPDGGAP